MGISISWMPVSDSENCLLSFGLAYPIEDGIPVMLESRARVLSADEKLNVSPVKRSGKG